MHMQSMHFRVLLQGYAIHRGFKDPAKFHPSKQVGSHAAATIALNAALCFRVGHALQRELDKNRELFRTFKREMRARMPSAPHC